MQPADEPVPLSETSGASPEESPYYNRAFWAGYKGASRGMLGGLLLGAGLGIAIGGAVSLGLLACGAIAGPGVAVAVIGVFTALGANYYRDEFTTVGAVAGSNAAVMEIAEQRSDILNHKLDRLLAAQERQGNLVPGEIAEIRKNVELMRNRGDHEFEKKFENRRPVFWKVAAVGALAGALLGAVTLGAGYVMFGETILNALGRSSGALLSAGGATAAATIGGATLAGATYGINRYYYRQLFNMTNAMYEGDLRSYDRAHDVKSHENTMALPNLDRGLAELKTASHAPRYASDMPRTFASGLVPVGRLALTARHEQDAATTEAKVAGSFQSRLEEETPSLQTAR